MTSRSRMNAEVGKRASAYVFGGYHCAESVALAVLEALGEDASQAVRHATPFGGGMGRSFDDVCGALSGGLIAIGQVHGRREPGAAGQEPGASWKEPAGMASELRGRFIKAYGTTNCGELRENFGKDVDAHCLGLVERIAEASLAVLRAAEAK